MEIFHAFGIEWKLLVIQMINFGIAFFVLRQFAYKPIIAILAKREKEIALGVAAADSAKKEKEAILEEKDGILRAAREEGGKIVEGLRKEGSLQERAMVREAGEQSAAILADAKAKAEEERAYILRESEKDVAKAAILAAEKILRTSVHTA
ncbi:MAG: ATP synthase F0 subunit B [Candidatus Lloydbacteria bacterium RIFCSPHIGHO2_01_FULL_49_22]|uniref:ATP synthase subunit b n=1 Tax=Candidatus Lloydbacteria bacterium RIFCSPHIGHO2_01_FULL_49_22 TaxID=1798658 RepID=A0A1G2CWS3_9BACT|nr:MAG: ATP synthase F0 subunit B [Candidatus Lloydbacteria bacterium RIFCSPHIGHO2_01_FULL_49_22]OGZ10243.1 MAG: ATP synthase F0 subunit B [Candidatus Lloydbacteria bacterium RIFCSPHIGHO2_02_FULL_50_18]